MVPAMQRSPLRELYGAFLAPATADALADGRDPDDLRHGVDLLRGRLGLTDDALAEVLVLDLGVPVAGLAPLGVRTPSWAVAATPLLSFSANLGANGSDWVIGAGLAAAMVGLVVGIS